MHGRARVIFDYIKYKSTLIYLQIGYMANELKLLNLFYEKTNYKQKIVEKSFCLLEAPYLFCRYFYHSYSYEIFGMAYECTPDNILSI